MASRRKRWVTGKIANNTRKSIEALDINAEEKVLIRLDRLQLNPFTAELPPPLRAFQQQLLMAAEERRESF